MNMSRKELKNSIEMYVQIRLFENLTHIQSQPARKALAPIKSPLHAKAQPRAFETALFVFHLCQGLRPEKVSFLLR